MQQIFTPELLVKHLYNETTPEEAIAIEDALTTNVALQTVYRQLQATKYALDEEDGGTPPSSVLQKIKAYSVAQSLVIAE